MAPPTPDKDTSSDGAWSTIVRRNRRKVPRVNPTPYDNRTNVTNGSHAEPNSDTAKRHVAPEDPREQRVAVREIETTFIRISGKWQSGAGLESLERLVRKGAPSHTPITQAICLGNGALAPSDESWDRRRTAHVQTAAFLSLAEILSTLSGSLIRCVFQEPSYSSADRLFLESLGHTVVDDPAALDMVTDTTLLWGVHLYRGVYSRALEQTLPAMFVGTKWTTWEEHADPDDKVEQKLSRLHEMHTTYDMFPFPPEEGTYVFSETCIYWKRNEGDETVGSTAGRGKDQKQAQEAPESNNR